jgi:ABC-type antimicrobial peptide transport system permease subunit
MSDVNALLIKTAGDERRMIGAVQQALQSNAGTPVYAHVRAYQDLLNPQLRSWRLGATLFSLFGILALGIAALGAFGVVSYLAAQRTREIGIRLALGGTRGAVAQLVMGHAVRMVAAGVAVGLAAAILVAPSAASMLFETSPRDLGVAFGAAAMLLIVAVIAAALPAWRASRLSPLIALRSE